MKLKDYDESMFPRERLIKYGVESLSLNDLISILLRNGIKDKNVKEVSSNLINEFKTLSNLCNASFYELTEIKGIGCVNAITLLAAFELGKRINSLELNVGSTLNKPDIINKAFTHIYRFLKQELFIAIYLDKNKKLLQYQKLFIGTIDKSIVHSREIIKYACKVSASYIVIMHNHPSGNLFPSDDDIIFTKELNSICRLINIPLIDHIITDGKNYFSFFENDIVFNNIK